MAIVITPQKGLIKQVLTYECEEVELALEEITREIQTDINFNKKEKINSKLISIEQQMKIRKNIAIRNAVLMFGTF